MIKYNKFKKRRGNSDVVIEKQEFFTKRRGNLEIQVLFLIKMGLNFNVSINPCVQFKLT